MNQGIIVIGITIVIISIFIYIIKYWNILEEFIKDKLEKKIFKIIGCILFGAIIFILLKNIGNQIDILRINVDRYKQSLTNDDLFEYCDTWIIKENNFFKNHFEKDYPNQKSEEPYIPDGFTYVEGEWDTGFVIQDGNGNQYVWVPCTNKEREDIVNLQRYNFTKESFISKDLCINDDYEEFIISALENGGFYISRFEIGNENGIPVSKFGTQVWNSSTKAEINEIVNQMYSTGEFSCKLINGYAYDTTLLWIMKNNQIENEKLSVENGILTGTKKYNNIYDFTDNVMEMTSEMSYGTVIIRGFPFKHETEYDDISIENWDRFSIGNDESYFSAGTLVGFRTIIYK